jgi:hypothetical protein
MLLELIFRGFAFEFHFRANAGGGSAPGILPSSQAPPLPPYAGA